MTSSEQADKKRLKLMKRELAGVRSDFTCRLNVTVDLV